MPQSTNLSHLLVSKIIQTAQIPFPGWKESIGSSVHKMLALEETSYHMQQTLTSTTWKMPQTFKTQQLCDKKQLTNSNTNRTFYAVQASYYLMCIKPKAQRLLTDLENPTAITCRIARQNEFHESYEVQSVDEAKLTITAKI